MDEMDRTQAANEVYEAAAIRNHFARRGDSRISPTNTCLDCGEKIPSARLKAMPDTERCIRCQTRLEQGDEVDE